jgi:5-formyltetrahydrofolate cyclo-ligase
MPQTSKNRKQELRLFYQSIRQQLGAQATGLNKKITQQLQGYLSNRQGDVLAGYEPVNGEVDPRELMGYWHQEGNAVGLPVVINKEYPLIFRRWQPGISLVKPNGPGGYVPSADMPEVFPAVILVPLLAFDRLGNRLGYGGGYYDRTIYFLRRHRLVHIVGVGFSCQEAKALPTNRYDQKLDVVITDEEVIPIISSAPKRPRVNNNG